MILEFILSLAWLLIVSFSLGFALTREKSVMTFGFGLAAFVILSVIMSLAGIPVHWAVFLGISLALVGYFAYRKELDLNLPRPDATLAVLALLVIINISVYWAGATSYPWLEDDDPWEYVHDAEWVSVQYTYATPYDGGVVGRGSRLEPFPPGYPVLIGVLHQLAPSLPAVLKFYNAFLIGIGLIFAFGFFERLTGNRRLALVAAFFLLVLPAYMNHFIWAQSLAIPLMLVSFYGLGRAREEQRFVVPTAVAIAAMAMTHPAVVAVFAIFFMAYAAAQTYVHGWKTINRTLCIVAIAVALACVYYVPTILKFGLENTASGIGLFGSLVRMENGGITYVEDTSGNAVYGVSDFLFPQSQGAIDQQMGIGLAIVALCIIGTALFVKDMRSQEGAAGWRLCGVAWLLIGLLGVEGNLLPIHLFPHRFWVYLSIPVALLSAHAYIYLEDRAGNKKRWLVAAVIVAAVLYTSAGPKYDVEMATWPPGSQLLSMPQIQGYVEMQARLPEHTKVFPLCTNDQIVVGFGMRTDLYEKEYAAFAKTAMNQSADKTYAFLAPRNYSYVVLDVFCVKAMGEEQTNAALADYTNSGNYTLNYSNGQFFLFKLKT